MISETMSAFEPDAQIRHYLATGSHDSNYTGWPGNNFVEAAMHASAGFRDALTNEVLTRASSSEKRAPLHARTIRDLTRTKVAPMIDGLFPKEEREHVLAIVERSVIFLTPENIVRVLRSERWLHTAWSLANLYLLSVGVDTLSDDAPLIVGLSQDTTCYVSMAYFDETDPCVDFIVHEVAHIFHNCKRGTVDLSATRRHEWLLDIEFRKRELFAYACEAYSCILAAGGTRECRIDALARHVEGELPRDESIDIGEYLGILAESVRSRSGWKVILRRCSPTRAGKPHVVRTRSPNS